MLEDLEVGDILYFCTGDKAKVKRVVGKKNTEIKQITAIFPPKNKATRWFYEKDGKWCGDSRRDLDIIKVEKSKRKEILC